MTEKEIFINKAKNKIAELGSSYVTKQGDEEDLWLLLALSDFLEAIAGVGCDHGYYNELDPDHELRLIHYYNHLADLNKIPYLTMTDYTTIVGQEVARSGDLYSTDILDFNQAVNNIVSNLEHNSLKGIQPELSYKGAIANERYHINKAMYDFLWDLMHPYTEPTVDLQLTTLPFTGLHEKGTSVTKSTLHPVIHINGGKSILAIRYYKNTVQFGGVLTEPIDVVDNSAIYNDTAFKMEVDFEVGGTKSDIEQILFASPIWYGSTIADATTIQIKALNKLVKLKSKSLELTYSIPLSNATASTPVFFYAMIPTSWGEANAMEVETFNTKPDWKIRANQQVSLLDGSIESYYIYEFINVTSGDYKILFKWL